MISATKLSICTLAYLYTLWTATFFPLFLSHSWKATYMISWRHPWGDSERGWGRSWKPLLSQPTVQLPCVVPHIFLWTSFRIPGVITLPCLLEVSNSHMTFSVLRISVSVGGMCLLGQKRFNCHWKLFRTPNLHCCNRRSVCWYGEAELSHHRGASVWRVTRALNKILTLGVVITAPLPSLS